MSTESEILSGVTKKYLANIAMLWETLFPILWAIADISFTVQIAILALHDTVLQSPFHLYPNYVRCSSS